MEYTFYYITNINYIGSTDNFKERKRIHKQEIQNGKSPLCRFNMDFEELDFQIIETCYMKSNEHARKRERYWIESYDSINNGANILLPWVSEEERKEHIQQYQKDYYQINKDKIKECYQLNKEQILEKQKEQKRQKINCPLCNIEMRKDSILKHNKTRHKQDTTNESIIISER